MPKVDVKLLEVTQLLRAERFAYKSRAFCVSVDIGLSISAVLFTLPSPTIAAVIPDTVPVKVGLALGA